VRYLRTVSSRVIAGTLFLLLVAFSLFSYFIIRFYTARMTDQAVRAAYRVSDFIAASTRYSMLLNRKQDVYQIIRTIADEPGVDNVRIYNKRGTITFSTAAAEQGRLVDLHAEACFVCHERARPLEALPTSNRARIYRDPSGHRVVGVITPVRNERACSASGCHQAREERTVLGVIDARMSLEQVDQAIGAARRRTLLWAGIAFVAIGTVSSMFLTWALRRPIRALSEGTRQLAAGNLDHRIDVHGSDDLSDLARSFNAMTGSLHEAQDENRRWALTLEDRVREKTEELRRINRQIVQVEKMASLGTLAASVAHELNNPLSGILTYARLDLKRIERDGGGHPLLGHIADDLRIIARETGRCGAIVKNLLLFSRKQEGEFHRVELREVIERSLLLVAHHMAMARVNTMMECDPPDLSVIGDDGQIQQALVALMVNAAEAMPDGGTLTLGATPAPDGGARLSVADTGAGIPPEVLPHVFEPFFTTKPQGKGVGLGLAIVYGIAQRHGAEVDVQSELGRGTTFTITFPPRDRAPERARGAGDDGGNQDRGAS
jgi:two-component system NtrC family sensor kinase